MINVYLDLSSTITLIKIIRQFVLLPCSMSVFLMPTLFSDFLEIRQMGIHRFAAHEKERTGLEIEK